MTINETVWHKRIRDLSENDAGVYIGTGITQEEFNPDLMSQYLFCDNCGMPTLKPENAHHKCANCHYIAPCCEIV
jgi:hypothetical protein